MGMATACANGFLKLLFNSTTWANIAQNGASPITSLYVTGHTGGSPPAAGDAQNVNEIAYTGFSTRIAVSRDTGGWTVTSNYVEPVNPINFPPCTGGSCTMTYFSVGKTNTGATDMYFSGTVTPNISIANGVTPQLTVATRITLT